jgi:hypothetical protein
MSVTHEWSQKTLVEKISGPCASKNWTKTQIAKQQQSFIENERKIQAGYITRVQWALTRWLQSTDLYSLGQFISCKGKWWGKSG